MQLALETSTNICSVAFKDREGEVHEKRTEVRGSHSEKLFLFIDELLKEHAVSLKELDSVIVSEGPGSYTGLRISASAVKGLLFDSKITLFAANTLAGFATSAIEANSKLHNVHSIIDARRVHVYHQQFVNNSGKLESSDKVEVIPIKEFQNKLKDGDAVIGTGLKRIDKDARRNMKVFNQTFISAVSLLKLFENDAENKFVKEVDPRQFEPKYYTSNQV